MKALIVDDDRTVRRILREILVEFGVEVVEAENGRQALALVKAERPDLMVLDLVMPEMGGQGVLQTIRSTPGVRNLPIVCCSAVDDRDQIVNLAGHGIVDYLLKPIRPRATRDRLQAIITRLRENADGVTIAGEVRPTLLFVHPDPGFRAFAVPLLEQRFQVVQASSGHEGERTFSRLKASPDIVCLGEGLGLLNEDQLVGVLRAIAREHGRDAPPTYLVARGRTVDPEKASRYQGILKQSLVATEFWDDCSRVMTAPSAAVPKPGNEDPEATERRAAG